MVGLANDEEHHTSLLLFFQAAASWSLLLGSAAYAYRVPIPRFVVSGTETWLGTIAQMSPPV
jgi:hypothetical protein